jgi:hypothetical protein
MWRKKFLVILIFHKTNKNKAFAMYLDVVLKFFKDSIPKSQVKFIKYEEQATLSPSVLGI